MIGTRTAYLMRKPLIAANWKMNPAPDDFDAPDTPYRPTEHIDVIVFATATDLSICIAEDIHTGAQFARPENKGAFTGDISMALIQELGCRFVLCGHSERRRYHQETDEFIAEQAKSALAHDVHPVVCIGETEQERADGKEKEVIKRQLSLLPKGITIAYEPVWAIGTGKTATPEQAQEMHTFIRSLLPDDVRDSTRIIYGGSMSPANAESLLLQADIDGGLIGGASLKPAEFGEIVTIARHTAERL